VFVDLPGYGYAKVSKTEGAAWKQLLEGYLHERPTLRAVVVLVDVRRGLEQEEADLIEFLEERPGLKVIIAATKVDKLPLNAQKPAMAKLSRSESGERLDVVGTSSETGIGRDALWGRIFSACMAAPTSA
jgi:GTP-binding protein